MTPLVASTVLLAAFAHASWNAPAHTIKDQVVAFTLIGGGAAIGTVFFRERFGLPRIAAAVLMVTGIGLMPHTS